MTDEQLKNVPMSLALMENLSEIWAAAIPEVCYAQATQDVIKALQSDGQYIVFQAPVGYRFGGPRKVTSGDYFPDFSSLTQDVNLIPVGDCAGMTLVTVEPLIGGVE